MTEHSYVFLGPQGSGKGTQAKILAHKLGVPHISTGELFRQASTEKTTEGANIGSRLASGQLISDEETNELVEKRLQLPDAQNGYLLDGYPRNLNQAEFLQSIRPPAKVLLLELSDDEAVSRLADRWVCSRCQYIYTGRIGKPNEPFDCTQCGGQKTVSRRIDDTNELAVRNRLATYHRDTEPLIDFYEVQGMLTRINASLDIGYVEQAINKELGLV